MVERAKRDFRILTQAEVDRLVAGARGGWFGTRDSSFRIDDFDLDRPDPVSLYTSSTNPVFP